MFYFHNFSDVNECEAMTDNCSLVERCENTEGSFSCICDQEGYELTADASICQGKSDSLELFQMLFVYCISA